MSEPVDDSPVAPAAGPEASAGPADSQEVGDGHQSTEMDRLIAEYQSAESNYHQLRKTALIGALIVALGILAMSFAPVPYVKLSPGPMFNTLGSYDGTELITISGTTTYPTSGELNLTTVTERGGPYGELTLPEALSGWLNHRDLVVPTTDLFPEGTTKDEAVEENQVNFTNSQSSATAAALNYLQIPVTSTVVVATISPGSPAASTLKLGDVVVSVDGTAVAQPQDLPPLVRARRPGQTVVFDIVRGGVAQQVNIVLAASPRDPSQGFVGVVTSADYRGPFEVTFGLSEVGGPSAGMMFSLAIIDKLTPENLANGQVVAGTGTIRPDGAVGAIGGIEQKMYAAFDAGAALFLAPKANCSAVVKEAPADLNVVAVESLSQAVDVLNAWNAGRTDLPRCS